MLTNDEHEYLNKTQKMPSSYANISEEEAIKRAVELQKTIYGEIESKKFDSIEISNISSPVGDYVIYFRVKVKNDIWDSRSVHIEIDANNGEFHSYYGEGIGNVTDFSYVPKITKQQALQMYRNEIKRLKADISIDFIVLEKDNSAKNSFGFAWHIYGNRHDIF